MFGEGNFWVEKIGMKRRKVLKEGKNLFVEEKNIWRRKKIVDMKNNEGGLKENI